MGVRRCCFSARTRYCPRPINRQPEARLRAAFFVKVAGSFMPNKVRIALDAMGGDVGVPVVVPGAALSLQRHPETEFLMFGDAKLIGPELEKFPSLKAASRVVHTDVAVRMDDKPSQALRRT